MVKNGICLGGASKQNALFSEKCAPKTHPCPHCPALSVLRTYIYVFAVPCTKPLYMHPVYIRPIAVSSAAVGIVSEQPRTYIYVQNHQLQQPRKNMPATKGVFEKVTRK